MNRTLIAFALTAAGLAFTAPANAGPLEDQFFAMDTSKDGIITRKEFVTFEQSQGRSERQANFAFDNTAGGDGRITLQEFRAGPVARTQSRSISRAQPREATRRAPARRSAPRRSSGGSFGGGGGS